MVDKNIDIDGNTYVVASAGKRILGGIIDLIIMFLFIIFFSSVLNLYDADVSTTNIHYSVTGWKFIFNLLVYFILLSIMEYLTSKTPGKFIAKTKVISEDAKKIRFWQAFARNIARLFDGIGFYLLGLIIILFDKNNQRLGDLIAKTYVINDSNK